MARARHTGGCLCGAVRLEISSEPCRVGICHCLDCGSSVFSCSADEVEVPLGVLDTPDLMRPTYEIWTRRRQGWLPRFDVASRYDGDREGGGRTEP